MLLSIVLSEVNLQAGERGMRPVESLSRQVESVAGRIDG